MRNLEIQITQFASGFATGLGSFLGGCAILDGDLFHTLCCLLFVSFAAIMFVDSSNKADKINSRD